MKKLFLTLLVLALAPAAHAVGGACPASVVSLGTLSCYYVAASGNDNNTGTTEAAPWLHAPGMPNCTANCLTLYNFGNTGFSGGGNVGSTGIIFRGGDTWHFGNSGASPYTGGEYCLFCFFGFAFNANPATYPNCVFEGPYSGCLYVGVDPTWYTGSAWARPIFTGDNPTVPTGFATSCPYQIAPYPGSGNNPSGNNVIVVMSALTILDNFELTGLCVKDTNLSGDFYVTGYGVSENFPPTQSFLTNDYFHGWSATVTAGTGSGAAPVGILGPNGGFYVYQTFDHIVIDGSDSNPVVSEWGTFPNFYHMRDSMVRYTAQGVGQNCHDIHDNIWEYIFNPLYSGHTNLLECNADAHTSTANVFYNNIARHVNASMEIWWFCPNTTPEYIFNNIMYDIIGQPWNLAGTLQYPACTWSGGINFFNNTTVDAAVPCGIGGSVASNQIHFLNAYNNHQINSPWSTSSPQCNGGPNSTSNVSMTDATATSQGYTKGSSGVAGTGNTCSNEITPCAPTASTNSTVGTGINEQAYCSALGAFTSEFAISVDAANACRKATTDGCTYITSNHSVQCPAQTAPNRSAAQWNSGAYEFGGGGAGSPAVSLTPSPVAFGNVGIGTNLTFPGPTLTNTGNANLVLNNPYFTITGVNAPDFVVVGGGSCAGGLTVTPGNTCTIAIKFTPTVSGAETAQLNISGNAVGVDTLTGTGVATVGAVNITPGTTTGSFVQGCFNFSNSGTSIACTMSTAQTLNNTNACFVSWSGVSGSASITDTLGNSYGSSLLNTVQSPLGAGTQSIFLVPGIKAGTNTITATLAPSQNLPEIKCAEFLGTVPADAVGAIGNVGSSGAITSSNLTVAFAPIELAAATFGCGHMTNGTGWTMLVNASGDIIEGLYSTTSGTFAAVSSQTPSGCYLIQVLPLDAPTVLNFGSQNDTVTSVAHVGTATNTGTISLTLNSSPHYYTITGPQAAEFAVTAGASNCTDGGSLAVGSSCTINVTFTPAAAGPRNATLNWGSNGANGTLSLTGTGVAGSQCGTPGFSPVAGVVSSGTVVTFTGGCASGTFCSTVDGSTPTGANNGTCTHGTSGGTVTVNVSETVQVISVKAANTDSLVATGPYTVNGATLATPTFSPTAPYTGAATTVFITFPVGSTLCLTLDASTPTGANGSCTHGSFNTGAIQLSATATLSVIATQAGFTNSAVASGLYTIISQVGLPVFAVITGRPGFPQTISITSPTSGPTICYTLNGQLPVTDGNGHCVYGGTLANGGTLPAINQTTLINAIGTESGLADSPVATALAVVASTTPNASPPQVIFLF
jgi:Chitobiase/beta-hexosaminidase C-terminal domain